LSRRVAGVVSGVVPAFRGAARCFLARPVGRGERGLVPPLPGCLGAASVRATFL